MIQQINLYQNKRKADLNLQNIGGYLIVLGITLLFFTVAGGYLFWQVNDSQSQLEQRQHQLAQTQAQVKALQAKYPAKEANQQLIKQLSDAEELLFNYKQASTLLTHNDSPTTQGFSRYFIALARQAIADIWLTHIFIDAERQQLSLQGLTYNPDRIPLLLQGYQQESIFNGLSFSKLNIASSEHDAEEMRFSISTQYKEAKEGNGAK